MNIVSRADNGVYRIKKQEKNKIPSKKLTQIEQYKLQKTKNQHPLMQRQEQLNNSTTISKQINTLSYTSKEDSAELSQKGFDLLKKMQIQSIEAYLEFSQY